MLGPDTPQTRKRAGAPGGLVAAIDVGSHGMRMAIAQARPGKRLAVVEELSVPIAIGADTFRGGTISATTTARVGEALARFREVLATYGVERWRAVATTAVRDASNREVFIDRVARLSGIDLEVIEAIEETRLLYESVAHVVGPRYGLRRGVCMLLSLGAGSTEIIVQRNGQILLSETRQLGTLRSLPGGTSAEGARPALEALVGKLSRSLMRTRDLPKVRHLIVLSSALARVLRPKGRWDAESRTLVVRRAALARAALVLERSGAEALASTSGLSQLDAEAALVALIELRGFLEDTEASVVAFPEVSTLTGMLLEARERLAGGTSAPLVAHVHSAALALGRKYRFDETHGRHVEHLALELYDALTDLCGLGERARLLLSAAALLHDIGNFVSDRAHQRHSAYLISNSEIIGLDAADLEAVAQVARLHRKRVSLGTDLASLPAPRRVEVVKLAAILRLADALDRDHRQLIDAVRPEVADNSLVLHVRSRHPSRADLVVIEAAVGQKGDLFHDTFGLAPGLREELAP